MSKEEFLNSVANIYNEATEKAIREIAEKAYKEGYQAAMAERPEEASYLPIKDDELEWHDIGLKDGYRVAFVEGTMIWNEAKAKYLLPTFHQLLEISKRCKLEYHENEIDSRGWIITSGPFIRLRLTDGRIAKNYFHKSNFFWSNEEFNAGNIRCYNIVVEDDNTSSLEVANCFKGDSGYVIALKKFE